MKPVPTGDLVRKCIWILWAIGSRLYLDIECIGCYFFGGQATEVVDGQESREDKRCDEDCYLSGNCFTCWFDNDHLINVCSFEVKEVSRHFSLSDTSSYMAFHKASVCQKKMLLSICPGNFKAWDYFYFARAMVAKENVTKEVRSSQQILFGMHACCVGK